MFHVNIQCKNAKSVNVLFSFNPITVHPYLYNDTMIQTIVKRNERFGRPKSRENDVIGRLQFIMFIS